jgi:hypothetical protein
MPKRLSVALLLAVAVLVPLAPLHAQGFSIAAGAGVSVPVGSMAEQRSIGERFVGSLGYQFPGSPMGLRVDLARTRLRGEPQPPGGTYDSFGDLRSLGFTANLVYRFAEGGVEPYALVGLGSYSMQIQGAQPNPYGWIGGLSGGLGAEFPLGGPRLFVEGRGKVLFSDYGAGEWTPGVYLPVTAGVRLPNLALPSAARLSGRSPRTGKR